MNMVFRRHIEFNTRERISDTEVRIALEDDFHHFRVQMVYSNNRITDIHATSIRIPYTLCGHAGAELKQLIGRNLNAVAHSVYRMTDARFQCTHLLDLAGLAIAASARNARHLQYDISVPMRTENRTNAILKRNGKEYLQWDVDHLTVLSPAPFINLNLKAGFAGWAINNISTELSEASLVLRRAVMISLGREINLDEKESANPTGRCFAQQPDKAASAKRVIGSTKDFTDREGLLCVDDRDWLDFRSN